MSPPAPPARSLRSRSRTDRWSSSLTLVDGDYRVATYANGRRRVTRTTSFDYSKSDRTTVTDPAEQKTTLFYDSAKR